MPLFEFDTPQGRFQVEAPDAQSALGVLPQAGAQQPPPMQMADASNAMGNSIRANAAEASQGMRSGANDASALRNFDATMRGAADAMTFGLSDEISAGLGAATGIDGEFGQYSKNLQAQRERDAADAEAYPVQRIGGQVVGGGALGLGLGKAGATLMKQGAPLLQNMLMGGVEGALYGGAYGAGSGEGVEDRLDRAKTGGISGAVTGAATPVVAKGIEGLANALRQSGIDREFVKSAPTREQLFERGSAAFQKVDDAGVMVGPEAVGDLAKKAEKALYDFGADPDLNPGAFTVLKRIRSSAEAGEPIRYRDVENFRRIATNAIRGTDNASDQEAMRRLVGLIDELEAAADPALAGTLKEGRDLWRRGSKSDDLADALVKAERQAARSGAGANIDNATRQQISSILNSKVRSKGFQPEEIEALERVVRGTPVQNALRLGGKLAPTGSVSAMGTIGLPIVAGEPMLGLGLAGLGWGMKASADRATTNNLALADAIIRAGKAPTTDSAARKAMEEALRAMGIGSGSILASDYAGGQ